MVAGSEQLTRALVASWRNPPLPLALSEVQLAELAKLLVSTGAGPLAWWRVKDSEFANSPAGFTLQQAYRLQVLKSALREIELVQVVSLLRSVGIEPVLVKGWAIAYYYAETSLRPYGDLDLCIHPSQQGLAEDTVARHKSQSCAIDLHFGFTDLERISFDQVMARSKLVRLGDSDIRVLSDEDHLRWLCIHLLRHGAFRPLWLCDIAVLVEATGSQLDWDLCLACGKRDADRVTTTIALARDLLGANIDSAPATVRQKRLPRWLLTTVLKNWSTPEAKNHGVFKHNAPIKDYLTNPAGLLKDLRKRWPDPLEATMSVGGPLNNWPRLPFQLANATVRTARFIKSLAISHQ
jgi:hypothetical protein